MCFFNVMCKKKEEVFIKQVGKSVYAVELLIYRKSFSLEKIAGRLLSLRFGRPVHFSRTRELAVLVTNGNI